MTEAQTSNAVLMIRPAAFGFNLQTAASNAFQREAAGGVQAQALAEFDGLASRLREAGVEVHVFDDTPEPRKPDAVFPNNWVSFHRDGTLVLYPMQAENRRLERRPELLDALRTRGFRESRRLDLSGHEREGRFLEGTGSLVLDREHRIAYACLSPRTDAELLGVFARELGYRVLAFHGVDGAGRPVYHTNVLMSVGRRFAVACLDSIRDPRERADVREALEGSGHELIELSLDQVSSFCGNILELRDRSGRPLIVMSERARAALLPQQLARLLEHGRVLAAPLATIEAVGGGGARCMLAEIHLPREAESNE